MTIWGVLLIKIYSGMLELQALVAIFHQLDRISIWVRNPSLAA